MLQMQSGRERQQRVVAVGGGAEHCHTLQNATMFYYYALLRVPSYASRGLLGVLHSPHF